MDLRELVREYCCNHDYVKNACSASLKCSFPFLAFFLRSPNPDALSLLLPPHTLVGKTLAARAVANRTDACFIRVIGSELVQKYVGEGARMVRELFTMARAKRACIIFFDEVDAIGGARSGGDDNGSDNEVQRTMLQIVTELDGFDARGNIKVLMATNRPDTLDPALLRPGRLDRKVEFGLPDLEGRGHILKIHSKRMNCDRDIRFELIARLCPNTTGAELHSVCTEAGMFAIRARRKSVSEKDFLDSVNKVVKGYKKFSSTPKVRRERRRRSSCCVLFMHRDGCCLWGSTIPQALPIDCLKGDDIVSHTYLVLLSPSSSLLPSIDLYSTWCTTKQCG